MENEFSTVRNVRVPRQQIDDMKAMYGAELVEDGLVLDALDRALKHHRATRGIDPDLVNLRDDPFHWYKHMILDVREPLTGFLIPVTHKPAWFKLPRLFSGITLKGES